MLYKNVNNVADFLKPDRFAVDELAKQAAIADAQGDIAFTNAVEGILSAPATAQLLAMRYAPEERSESGLLGGLGSLAGPIGLGLRDMFKKPDLGENIPFVGAGDGFDIGTDAAGLDTVVDMPVYLETPLSSVVV